MKIKDKVSLNFKCFIVGYVFNVLCFDLIGFLNIIKDFMLNFNYRFIVLTREPQINYRLC
jgi:hypothetical protein